MSLNLLLTALLDRDSYNFFEQKRRQYYPPQLNVVPAHLMLFHNLPLAEEKSIHATLENVCAHTQKFAARISRMEKLGKGVAYGMESAPLTLIRQDLTKTWQAWLIPQDRQKYRPHIVIQNKAAVEAARQLHGELLETFVPFSIEITGLALWEYHNGPWSKLRDYFFAED